MRLFRPVRRTACLPSCLAAALAFALAGCGSERRPNVVLVTLDTTRADFLSSYGVRSVQTPRFDALAEQGVRFERALSASAVTPVSHATILTGLYPYRHGLRVLHAGSGYRLPADVPTLASRFHEAGYATVAVHSAFPVSDNWGFGRAFDVFESFDGEMETSETGAAWDVTRLQRRSDDTTALALDRLAGVREPFFLWIHYWDPHDPWLYPPDPLMEGIPRVEGRPAAGSETYAREVTYMDAQFGRLLDGLAQAGRYANTIVAVTADHGEGLEDGLERHGWGAHRMLYQEQIWVPFLLRVPGGPAGRLRDPGDRREPDDARSSRLVVGIPQALGASRRRAGPRELPPRRYVSVNLRHLRNLRILSPGKSSGRPRSGASELALSPPT